jgi:hypothetical protein
MTGAACSHSGSIHCARADVGYGLMDGAAVWMMEATWDRGLPSAHLLDVAAQRNGDSAVQPRKDEFAVRRSHGREDTAAFAITGPHALNKGRVGRPVLIEHDEHAMPWDVAAAGVQPPQQMLHAVMPSWNLWRPFKVMSGALVIVAGRRIVLRGARFCPHPRRQSLEHE